MKKKGRRILAENKKYRSRTEIIRDILQAAKNHGNGLGKTQIMYNTFLSYNQIKEYIPVLIDNGLLKPDLGNQKFRITEKGLSLLKLCDQIADLIEKEEEQRPRW
jgi:predicted transcriptional regulator